VFDPHAVDFAAIVAQLDEITGIGRPPRKSGGTATRRPSGSAASS
jgi:hypothetical protein